MAMNLKAMIELLLKNDPMEVYQELMKSSDEFRGFVEMTKDKSAAEMIQCYNLDKVIREEISHT